MRTQNNTDNKNFPHKDLSYKLVGCFFNIRKNYGPGQKEIIYTNLIAEWLNKNKIIFEKEKIIKICSIDSGKMVGIYKPDFVINDKIILEIKSSRFSTQQDEKQLYFYLRNSRYEVGYLVNFSTPRLLIKRIIYTNDRKPFLRSV
ncbi:GxxExxY protein [Patescibacteria group bacterium]|nr:GxxExxY protein [Patescibacteria group bacterium]